MLDFVVKRIVDVQFLFHKLRIGLLFNQKVKVFAPVTLRYFKFTFLGPSLGRRFEYHTIARNGFGESRVVKVGVPSRDPIAQCTNRLTGEDFIAEIKGDFAGLPFFNVRPVGVVYGKKTT